MRNSLSALLFLFFLSFLSLEQAGCRTGATVTRIAVVAVGSATSSLHTEHQRVYVEATDALLTRVRSSNGTLAEYNTQVAPIRTAFEARSAAIQAITRALYSTARISDKVAAGEPFDINEVRQLILVIRDSMAALDRSGVLPAISIPPTVRTALATLDTLAATPAR